jgi:hypothetical protein
LLWCILRGSSMSYTFTRLWNNSNLGTRFYSIPFLGYKLLEIMLGSWIKIHNLNHQTSPEEHKNIIKKTVYVLPLLSHLLLD